jgi:hypothetical protein
MISRVGGSVSPVGTEVNVKPAKNRSKWAVFALVRYTSEVRDCALGALLAGSQASQAEGREAPGLSADRMGASHCSLINGKVNWPVRLEAGNSAPFASTARMT